ncbi:MAG TPA: GntR family transcriptional regulator [Anaerolineae bacterium]|nr:GntR family transcriptional regulator [Anaerolineae bacterium]
MDSWTLGAAAPMLTREEYVAKVLREAILRGEFEPGQRLDQTRIAQELRVSRTPVRNALLILSNEGLVEMAPHAGAMVSEISLEEVGEIFFIRGVLEGIAARLAAERMTDEDLAVLEGALQDLDAASNLDEWLAENKRFHFHIYGLAKRPRLLSLIADIHDLTLPYSHRFIGSDEHKQIARAGHHQIFEACRRRDGQLAERAIQEHMETVCKAVVGSCSQPSFAYR